jgi:opacity protein-like surface antigen
MKKVLALTTFIVGSAVSATTLAAPAGQTFVGPSIGLQVNSEKYSVGDTDADFKHFSSFNLIGDYGFDFGNDFVGLVQGSVQLGKSNKVASDDSGTLKRKNNFMIGYAQGYRILPSLLPYIKLDYNFGKTKWSDTGDNFKVKGFGYGLGTKFAISQNVELGVEYMRHHLKADGDSFKSNTFSFLVSYRF